MRMRPLFVLALLLPVAALVATATVAEAGSIAVYPTCAVADSPAVRLSLEQVKARLAAGTEEKAPDLSNTDLSGLDLHGVDFKRANLTGARLVGSKLAGANLFTSDLTDAV